MKIIYYFKKVIHRTWRIITCRKGLYGKIGKHNRIMKNVSIHELADVGNYNYIGTHTMILHAKIGSYCSIAPYVKIGQSNHDLSCVSTSTRIAGNGHGVTDFSEYEKPSIIGNDVWLAANVVVRQGVEIGTGAVVGAGAVVTKNIPPYEIWGGVPARFIAKRFSDDDVKKLLESRWWENEQKEAIEICKKLQMEVHNFR